MIDTSVAISSRIRLARNISGYNFPCVIRGTEKEKAVLSKCVNVLRNVGGFDFHYMHDLSDLERRAYVERYLISNNLASSDGGVLAMQKDGPLSVMINEEDHLREQCIVRGFDLFSAYKKIAALDGVLAANLPFVKKNGVFFTACPSNLGTGLRASVMLFLPAITDSNRLGEIYENAVQYGLTIRGRFGEGSGSENYLYQVSNEITYKISEREILELVTGFVKDTISIEMSLRKKAYEANKDAISDKVLRALGILKNCFILSYEEFVELICMLKLGLSLGILKSNFDYGIDDLLITANRATLITSNAPYFDSEDKLRARFVQNALDSLNVCKKF